MFQNIIRVIIVAEFAAIIGIMLWILITDRYG